LLCCIHLEDFSISKDASQGTASSLHVLVGFLERISFVVLKEVVCLIELVYLSVQLLQSTNTGSAIWTARKGTNRKSARPSTLESTFGMQQNSKMTIPKRQQKIVWCRLSE
jgi:hypothetical protein